LDSIVNQDAATVYTASCRCQKDGLEKVTLLIMHDTPPKGGIPFSIVCYKVSEYLTLDLIYSFIMGCCSSKSRYESQPYYGYGGGGYTGGYSGAGYSTGGTYVSPGSFGYRAGGYNSTVTYPSPASVSYSGSKYTTTGTGINSQVYDTRLTVKHISHE
jgi:hypothetical protein